jgi:hypothetical protein
MRPDELLKRIVELGATSARITSKSGPTVSIAFVMQRNTYTEKIEPYIGAGFAELRGIQDMQEGTGKRGVKTGGGQYRYDVVFYLWDENGNKLEL